MPCTTPWTILRNLSHCTECWVAFDCSPASRCCKRPSNACEQIVDLYSQPNLTAEQIRDALDAHKFDPVKNFSSVCREELSKLVPFH